VENKCKKKLGRRERERKENEKKKHIKDVVK
jgi:hypothetical protein